MNTTATLLPVPPHFDPKTAAIWGYTPDEAAVATAAHDWAKQHGVRPAATDARRVHVLVIDAQNDFTNPKGTLYVGGRSGTGGIEDSVRTAEFLYRNLPWITQITPTLDTHFPFQIFFPAFWRDSTGAHPDAHTIIEAADVLRGAYSVDPGMAYLSGGSYPWLQAYARWYCEQLELADKYKLYLWPYHCQLGSVGHSLAGVIQEAVKFHAFARAAQPSLEIKGTSWATENYSVLGPEVEIAHDGTVVGEKNTRFIDTLLGADHVVILGQAASHCVKSTIDDLLDQINTKDPELVRKVYIVRDCMSAVAVPDGNGGFLADFTPDADAALRRFADAGMHVVDSTTPMADWPDMTV